LATLQFIATSGISRVLEYSIRSSTEYSSSKKLDSHSPSRDESTGIIIVLHYKVVYNVYKIACRRTRGALNDTNRNNHTTTRRAVLEP